MITNHSKACRGGVLMGVLATLVITVSSNTFAMNQEGHDNWMTDFPPATVLLEAIPEARPLPSRNCPVTADMLASNPFEQIPLPRYLCPRNLLPAGSQSYPTSTR